MIAASAPPCWDPVDALWVLVASVFVLGMMPALGLFEAGLLRARNVVSVLTQVFAGAALLGVMWMVVGYSFVFGPTLAHIIGSPAHFAFFRHVAPINSCCYNPSLGVPPPPPPPPSPPPPPPSPPPTPSTPPLNLTLTTLAPSSSVLASLPFALGASPSPPPTATPPTNPYHIPTALHMLFQMMFASITPLLITGAFAGRLLFRPFLAFVVLWEVLVYYPVAHWIWNRGGWLAVMGAQDFAGGIVIHATAGIAALVCCAATGPRSDITAYNGHIPAHSIPIAATGGALLWVGWFSFNAGSALGVSDVAIIAALNTEAASVAGGTVMLLLSVLFERPSVVHVMNGAIAGLAGVTPAAGYVNTQAALVIGALCAAGAFAMTVLLRRTRLMLVVDDALDVSSVHGLPGIIGAIATGFAADTEQHGGGDTERGILYGGGGRLLGVQVLAIVVAVVYSGIITAAILGLLHVLFRGRISAAGVVTPSGHSADLWGLDEVEHGHSGYVMDDLQQYGVESLQSPLLRPGDEDAAAAAAARLAHFRSAPHHHHHLFHNHSHHHHHTHAHRASNGGGSGNAEVGGIDHEHLQHAHSPRASFLSGVDAAASGVGGGGGNVGAHHLHHITSSFVPSLRGVGGGGGGCARGGCHGGKDRPTGVAGGAERTSELVPLLSSDRVGGGGGGPLPLPSLPPPLSPSRSCVGAGASRGAAAAAAAAVAAVAESPFIGVGVPFDASPHSLSPIPTITGSYHGSSSGSSSGGGRGGGGGGGRRKVSASTADGDALRALAAAIVVASASADAASPPVAVTGTPTTPAAACGPVRAAGADIGAPVGAGSGGGGGVADGGCASAYAAGVAAGAAAAAAAECSSCSDDRPDVCGGDARGQECCVDGGGGGGTLSSAYTRSAAVVVAGLDRNVLRQAHRALQNIALPKDGVAGDGDTIRSRSSFGSSRAGGGGGPAAAAAGVGGRTMQTSRLQSGSSSGGRGGGGGDGGGGAGADDEADAAVLARVLDAVQILVNAASSVTCPAAVAVASAAGCCGGGSGGGGGVASAGDHIDRGGAAAAATLGDGGLLVDVGHAGAGGDVLAATASAADGGGAVDSQPPSERVVGGGGDSGAGGGGGGA